MTTRNGNNTLSWRVAELETSMEKVDRSLDSILQNHLPHLHEEIASLRTRVNLLIVAVVVEVGVILIGRFL
jgi:hypothetical protein